MSLRRTKAGWAVCRLHYSADPTLVGERLQKERNRYTSEAWWNLEMEIKYDALQGARVYPDFDPAIHVIPHERIPRRLCCFSAIDPHPRTPHAFLWIGLDRWSDVYVYREMWPSIVYGLNKTVKDDDQENSYTTKDYVETVALKEGNFIEWRNPATDQEYGVYRQVKRGTRLPSGRIAEKAGEYIIYRFMDQAGKAFSATGHDATVQESLADRYSRYGMPCVDPYKIHKAGEDAIREWLRPRRHEFLGSVDPKTGQHMWPRLHISDRCPELILELTRYRYETSRRTDEKELKQKGVEARSHLIDLLRYLATADLAYIKSLETDFGEMV